MARDRRSNAGGTRAGTPGRQYGRRTDLNLNRAPVTGLVTPASGGIPPPPIPRNPGQPPPAPGEPTPVNPDTVSPLDAPTARPTEPVTAGIATGPGPGPAPDPNRADLLSMKKYLPILVAAANNPTTPASVVAFVNYLQSQI